MTSFKQRISDFFNETPQVKQDASVVDPGGQQFDGSMIKEVIPAHLYKPPFGYPRTQDVITLRKLAKNAYIRSVISTIQFEVAATKWDIVPKDGFEENPVETKLIKDFFRNPNGNAESFEYIMRQLVQDILELDSGVLVKVFDANGNFKQVFARDGGSFLKNPDIHGYMGNRDDIIPIYYFQYNPETRTYDFITKYNNNEAVQQVQERAAYFQYGWSNASIPIPFGKREIIWMSANPQTTDVYGRSPLEVLGDVIYTLLYGASFNLDFYVNNNIPEGVIQMLGASKDDITAFRTRWQQQFMQKDIFDVKRKKFFVFPITNQETKFTPFTFNSKDLEVLEQQKWFWKLVLACFGVTPSEMGFTEDSNRATEVVQQSVSKRRAVRPLLSLLEYHFNLQLLPEIDRTGKYEFKFVYNDIDEDMKKAQLENLYIQMGVKSSEMVAEEMGIDIARLAADKEKQRQQEIEMAKVNQPPVQQKSMVEEPKDELDEYFKDVEEEIISFINKQPDAKKKQLGQIT